MERFIPFQTLSFESALAIIQLIKRRVYRVWISTYVLSIRNIFYYYSTIFPREQTSKTSSNNKYNVGIQVVLIISKNELFLELFTVCIRIFL